MRRHRQRVTWTQNQRPQQPAKQLPYFSESQIFSEEDQGIYSDKLNVGSLWITTTDLERLDLGPGYEIPEFPYLSSPHSMFRTSNREFYPKGFPSIYAGSVRAEERARNGQTIRVLRHTFIMGGVRYMTRNILDFKPA
jgi:hypothetical protein